MSLSIKLPSSSFTKFFTSLTLPDRTGLLGEFVIGGTQAASIRNRAAPSSPATVVNAGSITYSANYATVLNSNAGSYGFNTGILAPAACSVIAISSRNVSFAMHTYPIGAGSTGLWNDFNTAIFTFSNGQSNGATDQAQVARTPPAEDSTTMFFQAGVGDIGSVGKMFVGKSGALVSDVGTATWATRHAGPFYIGGVDDTNFGGGAGTVKRVAYAAVFNRLLSDAEVASIYAQLTAFYANRGLAVN